MTEKEQEKNLSHYKFKFRVKNEVEGVLSSVHGQKDTRISFLDELKKNFPEGEPEIIDLVEISDEELTEYMEQYMAAQFFEAEEDEDETPALLN